MSGSDSTPTPPPSGGEEAVHLEPREEGSGRSRPPFPIIGIGSSAGGLQALEAFFRSVPQDAGQAFVLVQHMDPSQKGHLVEILQRSTTLPVVEITDRMVMERGHVYVIPPNCDLSLLHGVLHLLEPSAPRGLRLPIDTFFRFLADDAGDHALGVILSGMGSDGTLGLRAIKERSGAAFVQDPDSAKFDAMPRSAIEAGVADVVAPAEELHGKIVAYLRHAPLPAVVRDGSAEEGARGNLDKILVLLRSRTGHDFSLYKESTLRRRIERRMGLHHLTRMPQYVRFLRENAGEGDLLFKELLIGVTSFFRDPDAWEDLRTGALPELVESRGDRKSLRAWVAGCSTGEEAYSLAMILSEVLEAQGSGKRPSIQIFATDLDRDAIDRARMGVFPQNIVADVSEERLSRFFVEEARGYRVGRRIRDMVIFAPQNMAMDPPFTHLDLLTCRNVLIYLTAELQRKLMPLFHYSLEPGGLLFLGNAETVGSSTDLFEPVPGRGRVFKRIETNEGADRVDFPSVFSAPLSSGPPTQPSAPAPIMSTLQVQADRLLLERYVPAAVLVGREGDILYVSGRTGRYLEPAAGRANWNIFAMAREGLRGALVEGFERALGAEHSVTLPHLTVETDGGSQGVQVVIQHIQAEDDRGEIDLLQGKVMVTFRPVDLVTPGDGSGPPEDAGSDPGPELVQLRGQLRRARQEMRTHQEELQSANEELQSTNEELQSTNEELTTSKEELQSMNEELHTVNHELQAKLDELTLAGSDMANLLNSTRIATLFLDNALLVRRFTTPTTSIIRLIPGDVGRPITDITSTLRFPGMSEDCREVLDTLVTREREVSAGDGRWFAVRIMPYRTHDDRIDGVVLTFNDISESKALEQALREAQSALEGRLATHEDSGNPESAMGEALLPAASSRTRVIPPALPAADPGNPASPEGTP